MTFAFWVVIIITLLYEPIKGYLDYKKLKVAISESQNVRLKFYRKVLIDLWVPTIFILLIVAFSQLNLNDIGFNLPKINTNTLGPWVTYTALGIGILYVIIILYYLFGYRFSEKFRVMHNEAKQKESNKLSFSEMLPVTVKEKKVWTCVSITAGITEEIIYRGFLIYAFGYLYPNLSIWLVIVMASLLFGLGHIYQGLTGVLKTTIIGLVFSVIFIGIGSILPLIIVHFLIDYVAKLGES